MKMNEHETGHDMDHMNMDHMNMDHMQMDDSEHDEDMMMHGGQMMHMGNLKQKFWLSLVAAVPIIIL